ncbi:MAG: acetolactate decarboxylase [Sulfuritalea sp.]|nr:acetolactate decarboxylase [Sulfuritalea sp.]MDP1982914.1 acetolactate decarboxylase [Sulfuritalea sp.]
MRTTLIAVAWLALGMNPVLAQHGAQGVAATAAGANPAVQAHGSFQRMQHRKDFSAQAALKDEASSAGVYGVGALADLAGEITIHDGAVNISHGKNMDGSIDQRQAGDAQAALLATARVAKWKEVAIPGAMKQADLQAFIVAQARAAGLDTQAAFPFLIRGEIENYRWHVIAEPNPRFGGHGGNAPMAKQFDGAGKGMTAEVVGFHSGDALEGIISHPGEKFHEHLLDPTRTLTGHLDAYDIAAGAELLLPASR